MTNLYRKILPKNVFSKYIPSSNCKPTYIGNGDTGFSLLKMADVVNNNIEQGKEISKVLTKNNLADTTASIHNFLYNNFQYKADQSDQILRSLSCSWAERETGIDCKSYSIAASIILSNLGISHSFRRVKQPSFLPNQYTHVYVIVPNNQKTKSLTDGYFVIDGTLPTMQEVKFLQKDDFPIVVSGLGNPDTDNPDDEPKWYDKIFDLDWDKLSFGLNEAMSAPGGILKNLSCIGGTTVSQKRTNETIDQFNLWLTEQNILINKAIKLHLDAPRPYTLDFNPVGEAYENVYKNLYAVREGIANFKALTPSWNSCSKRNLDNLIDYTTKCADGFFKSIKPFIKEYFDEELIGSPYQYDMRSKCAINGIPVGFVLCSFEPGGRPLMYPIQKLQFTLKPNVTAIPVFEFTPPVVDAIASGNGIQNIRDTIATFQQFMPLLGFGGGNSGGGGSSGGTIDFGNNNNQVNPNDRPALLSGSNLLLGGLIIGAMVYGFGNMKDKKTLKK